MCLSCLERKQVLMSCFSHFIKCGGRPRHGKAVSPETLWRTEVRVGSGLLSPFSAPYFSLWREQARHSRWIISRTASGRTWLPWLKQYPEPGVTAQGQPRRPDSTAKTAGDEDMRRGTRTVGEPLLNGSWKKAASTNFSLSLLLFSFPQTHSCTKAQFCFSRLSLLPKAFL